MPRCPECAKAVIVKRHPEADCWKRLRIWSSGFELIRLAETGCDLCSFIRRTIEKVSTENTRRLDGRTPIVLQDCHSEIVLHHSDNLDTHGPKLTLSSHELDHMHSFTLKPTRISSQFEAPKVHANAISHTYELLEACVLGINDYHGDCELGKTDLSSRANSLPRRLLDLSHGNDILTFDVQVWVATARATIEELCNYCTLSYRWGERPPDCMLSTQFIGEKVMSLSDMPQTFKDAIVVARSLRIRFIWIDALCIIQPSAHGDFTDWEAEGPRMWLVYQNAICNISASCSSDPSDGFLWKVGTDCNATCSIPEETEDGTTRPLFLISAASSFYRSVVLSSLNRRGWVAQERLLSRRVLHFTEEGVFWECQAVNQTYKDEWDWSNPSCLSLREWLFFIEFYSASTFTQVTDRLIALSSIARSVPVERFGDTYFAGIWKKHLGECLSWRSGGSCSVDRRRPYLAMAPSWSWASVPDGVVYSDDTFFRTLKTWVKLEGVSVSLAQASNPYGNLEKGALTFLARMATMSLPTNNTWAQPCKIGDIQHLSSVRRNIHWDEAQDLAVTERVYAVVPLRMTNGYEPVTFFFAALIVTLLPSTGDANIGGSCRVYRRIGLLEWDCHWNYDREPDPHLALDAIFPDTTLHTIVIK